MSDDFNIKGKDGNPSKIEEDNKNSIEKEEIIRDLKANSEYLNKISEELSNSISDIRNAKQQEEAIVKSQTGEATDSEIKTSTTVNKTAEVLTTINTIKTELCKLPLDFCEKEYIAEYITPLLTTIDFISSTGVNLSTTVSILTTSPIVPRKKSKLKDTIDLVYKLNEDCEELYEVLHKRLKSLKQDSIRCNKSL